MDSDIHCLRLQSSKILSVNVKPDDEASTSSESQVVRLKKIVQTAEVSGWQGRYTATTLEPVDEEDQNLFKKIAKSVLRTAVCHRSALLTQVFAVTESDAMTMLTYNDLTNANEAFSWYWNKDRIVVYYLVHIYGYAVQSLRDDKALTFPVTHRWEDWSIDLKTLTCQYNPANISLNPPSEEDLRPYPTRYLPLRQDAGPQLNPTEIIAHVEKNLGDFLYLIAAGSGGRWITDLSKWAQNGLLTFGAIVQRRRPGILAHFPSTPSPKLFCKSYYSPNVEASYSNSGRVDLSFRKTGNVNVTLHFGLRIPNNDLRAAYLCQSLPFYDDCRDVRDVVCIDLVGFHLEGIFCEDPTTRPKPAYLFIPPLHTELINGLHCLRYPLSRNVFYWSNDPQGRDEIAEKDWERLRIPKLSVWGSIGTYWEDHEYAGVWELLHQKNRALDGKQYARERGYPELIPGDPHDTTRITELESSEPDSEPKTPPSPSQLTSPSTYSLVEAPPEPKLEPEDAPIVSTPKEIMVTPTCWARGFLNRFSKSLLPATLPKNSLNFNVTFNNTFLWTGLFVINATANAIAHTRLIHPQGDLIVRGRPPHESMELLVQGVEPIVGLRYGGVEDLVWGRSAGEVMVGMRGGGDDEGLLLLRQPSSKRVFLEREEAKEWSLQCDEYDSRLLIVADVLSVSYPSSMTEVEDMEEASEGQAPGTAAEGKIEEITYCVVTSGQGPPSIKEAITEVTLPTASVSGAGSTTPLALSNPSPSPNTSLSLFPPCQSPKIQPRLQPPIIMPLVSSHKLLPN
ncbi:hypothetical protein PQX77_017188 [Marasmius sp. AFHP31]|nr:hypothetical protein PQX77_017188 [Marasmius sp. AFHP31]